MKYFFVLAILAFAFIGGCTSDDNPSTSGGTGTMQVSMVDAPASGYDSIVVTVTEVSVHSNTGTDNWITLSSGTKTFNLLSLVNGNETILGTASLSAGTYSQLRLTLGDSCRIYSSGVMVVLKVPSNEIKLNIHTTIQANVTAKMVLDFDANRSIVSNGVGLILKPVIKVLSTESSGSISGSVNTRSSVFIYGNNDTLSTVTGTNHSFKFSYVTPGVYSMLIQSADAFHYDSMIVNIGVVQGEAKSVGSISLRSIF